MESEDFETSELRLKLADEEWEGLNEIPFKIDREKAKALMLFFVDVGYISNEFHPIIHEIYEDLYRFLNGPRR